MIQMSYVTEVSLTAEAGWLSENKFTNMSPRYHSIGPTSEVLASVHPMVNRNLKSGLGCIGWS